MGNFFNTIITQPLAYVFRFIFDFCDNYGLTIILFTVFIKLVLFPLTYKQQKSMTAIQALQPKINEINRKYNGNKEKISEETMKLYQKYNVNPMAGCLPLLIQLPVIFLFYQIIRCPLQYILKFPKEAVSAAVEAIKAVPDLAGIVSGTNAAAEEIAIASHLADASLMDVVKTATEGFEGLIYRAVDFQFLGLDLSLTPTWTQLSWLWVIPILAAATQYLSTWIMKKTQPKAETPKKKGPNGEQMPDMASSMNKTMPIMTAVFCFMLPAGIGVYWIVSNIMQMITQVCLNLWFAKRKEQEA
ncbi:MAG: YidC/Oxa1 family membrane protein insertase [Clostridia bacterium]|nr:YidC/Oxa1 family membrane protein insertase [Clostridia bacterium]